VTEPEPTIRVDLDPRNPGEFFACCGLLELADRLWGGAEGWFTPDFRSFCLRPSDPAAQVDPAGPLQGLGQCAITSLTSEEDTRQLAALRKKGGSEASRKKKLTEEELALLKRLESELRVVPVVLGGPFHLTLDWWTDDGPNNPDVKTWAGKQEILTIVLAMRGALAPVDWSAREQRGWLRLCAPAGRAAFNFDALAGCQSTSLDVGFSLDALKMSVRPRPLVELLCLIGLQRVRPAKADRPRTFVYRAWTWPLPPDGARVAVAGQLDGPGVCAYQFSLMCRDSQCRYKAFLPASPVRGDPR
jgi:CRISPR-associated protein Csb3